MSAVICLLLGFQFVAAFLFVLFISFSKGISMFPFWGVCACVIVCLCGYIYAKKRYGISKDKKKTLIFTLGFNVMFILYLGVSALFIDVPYEGQTSSLANGLISLQGMLSTAINIFPIVSTLFFIITLIPQEEPSASQADTECSSK